MTFVNVAYERVGRVRSKKMYWENTPCRLMGWPSHYVPHIQRNGGLPREKKEKADKKTTTTPIITKPRMTECKTENGERYRTKGLDVCEDHFPDEYLRVISKMIKTFVFIKYILRQLVCLVCFLQDANFV